MTLSTRQEGVVAQIFERVTEITGVSRERMVGPSREQPTVQARWVAMDAIRGIGLTLKQVAGIFNRDHTSVIHALDKVTERPDLEMMSNEAAEGLVSRPSAVSDPSVAEATRAVIDAQEALNRAVAILAQIKPENEES
jgi:hypothetical protein